ncbi:glycosyltransferase [Pseudoclavibacter terrae]|uniref:Glycosyltransferase family 4 protein n=1 Tax=Pseudoclavibacter terrae TaxID=1530195 RepID=A0A7J5B520_9MICO|nr:glycosyltransferase [Pseudoclavibacter terrae]KAB1638791.1 glycosyltransferase family 4 protein [Pseudoclavibacter terrae]
MRILVWYMHGGWANGFLSGAHEYLVPVAPGQEPPPLPAHARAVPLALLREEHVDIVVLQRLEEFGLVIEHLGRTPGHDIPAVFVEHNTPKMFPVTERHPLADDAVTIVHVTHFNDLVWDCGPAATRVIEHGVPDPGHRYTGELPALGVVINEPVRRWRVTGTDLLPSFAEVAPVDAFGIAADLLPAALPGSAIRAVGDLPTARMHAELARRRAYLHPFRWTSLGLSLLEAMHLGMPVLALATTEAHRAVPPEAGAISTDIGELRTAAVRLIEDPEEARRRGSNARAFVLEHFGLQRFLDAWDALLHDELDAFAARRNRTANHSNQAHHRSEGANR